MVGKLILVHIDGAASGVKQNAYHRVASRGQLADLDRQVAPLVSWEFAVGMAVDEVVTEVGSGIINKRRKLDRILADPKASIIIAEHRGRLVYFGAENQESALSAQARRVAVSDLDQEGLTTVRRRTSKEVGH